MYRGTRGPSKDEKRNRNKDTGHQPDLKAGFWGQIGVAGHAGLHVVAIIEHIDGVL